MKKCDYCSDKYRELYQPKPDTFPERCPRCHNPMEAGSEPPHPDAIENDLVEPGFCPNIYGCKAGSNLWECASDYEAETCKVCPEPASPLMLRRNLRETVMDCPLCSVVLSPLYRNNEKEWVSGHDVAKYFSEKKSTEFAEALRHQCTMCGAEAGIVLKWMENGGFLELKHHPRQPGKNSEEKEEDKKNLLEEPLKQVNPASLPDIEFREALELLITFREHLDDRKAFLALHKAIEKDLHSQKPNKQETILRIFPAGSAFSLVLRKRLSGLWKHLKDLEKRRKQWLHRPEAK